MRSDEQDERKAMQKASVAGVSALRAAPESAVSFQAKLQRATEVCEEAIELARAERDYRALIDASKALCMVAGVAARQEMNSGGSQGAANGLPVATGDPLERLRALPLAEARAEVARGKLVFDEAERIIAEREAKGD